MEDLQFVAKLDTEAAARWVVRCSWLLGLLQCLAGFLSANLNNVVLVVDTSKCLTPSKTVKRPPRNCRKNRPSAAIGNSSTAQSALRQGMNTRRPLRKPDLAP